MQEGTNRVLTGKRLAILAGVVVLIAAALIAFFAMRSTAQDDQAQEKGGQAQSGQSQEQQSQDAGNDNGGGPDPARGFDPGLGYDPDLNRGQAMSEVRELMAAEGLSGRALAEEKRERQSRFSEEENVFLANTISLHDLENPEEASAVVPLFRGIDPDGNADEEYIITEASDFRIAQMLGVNYSPKLVYARGSGRRPARHRRGRPHGLPRRGGLRP